MNKNIIIVIGIVVVISIVAAIYGFMKSQNGASNVPAYGTAPQPSASEPSTQQPPASY